MTDTIEKISMAEMLDRMPPEKRKAFEDVLKILPQTLSDGEFYTLIELLVATYSIRPQIRIAIGSVMAMNAVCGEEPDGSDIAEEVQNAGTIFGRILLQKLREKTRHPIQ